MIKKSSKTITSVATAEDDQHQQQSEQPALSGEPVSVEHRGSPFPRVMRSD
ncbi:MAG: hypothetical protein ACPG1Z_06605 [Planctomycetota bacterium]